MRTLGIDLAAQSAKTAACVIDWRDAAASVETLEIGCDDESLLGHAAEADKVGIDSPFGWPDPFVSAVTKHHQHEHWPGASYKTPLEQSKFREGLSFRATDLFIRGHRARPLSVSTDKIGVTTMRCAYLLDQLASNDEGVDRAGGGKVVEVYPAAALMQWGLTYKGYKRRVGLENLRILTTNLLSRLDGFSLSQIDREACETSDDCFDALVSSLVARAVALGLTREPESDEQVERASREGWIHLPVENSLGRLG